MRLTDYLTWIANGQAGAFFRLSRRLQGLYAVCFLAQAGRIGVLAALQGGAKSLEELAAETGTTAGQFQALAGLMDLGVSVGEIGSSGARYRLKGRLARALARPELDPFLALAQEAGGLHTAYIGAAPGDAESGPGLAGLTNRFSEVVARSSRIVEPILMEVVGRLVPRSGPFDLLEIGSGSGVYMMRALALNPELQATGVEVSGPVARSLQSRLAEAGLDARATVLATDVRDLDFPGRFDGITLFNNIYYFPEPEHRGLLTRLLSWLRPGGVLAVATLCRGGRNPLDAVMHMWSAMTPGASVLVDAAEFQGLMRSSGFAEVAAQTPSPLEPAFKVFVGRRPEAG